jgi:4-diphosphocytidyl-2-C-methyl-D-erythritol kinase
MVNDCLPVVSSRYAAVAAALEWLDHHGEARLTGTGACVFAAFGAEQAAREVQKRLPEGWRGFTARGLNRSPLLGMNCG